MSSIGVQIQRRKKGRYVSIIECFTDPVTGKRTSRTIKPFGYVEKDLEEDPDFMAKVYAECDQLRVDRAEAKRLRERQDMRLRLEREAYGSARLCIYGDAVLRRVWTELGRPRVLQSVLLPQRAWLRPGSPRLLRRGVHDPSARRRGRFGRDRPAVSP